MVNSLGLLKEELGRISIQAYGGLIEKTGTAAFVRIKELGKKIYKFKVNENPKTLPVFEAKMPLEWKRI